MNFDELLSEAHSLGLSDKALEDMIFIIYDLENETQLRDCIPAYFIPFSLKIHALRDDELDELLEMI